MIQRNSIFRLLVSPAKRPQNRGYVLPMTLGLGMAMLMLTLTGVMVAQTSLNISATRKQSNLNQSIADSAANRVLALLSASDNASLLGRNYDPINPKTGKNYLGADGLPNSGDETTTSVNQWSGVNPILLNGNIGSAGTYVLRAYRYDDIRQQGILVVEGRYKSTTSVLIIGVSILNKPAPVAGLWITAHSDSDASSDVRLETNIRDSTSAGNTDANDRDKIKAQQVAIPPNSTPVTYTATPNEAFPPLPSAATTPPNTGSSGVYTLSQITDSTGTLPRVGDTPSNGVIAYRVTNTSSSIDMGGGTLNLGTGNETIVLYLESGISMSGGSQIKVASGSKLIIYARQNISLSGGSSITATSGTNAGDIQMYLSGIHNFSISGSSVVHAFLFAPQADINSSGSSIFHGAAWARTWSGSGGSILQERSIDLTRTPISVIPGKKQIRGITSWQIYYNF
jgi:hypothetical protein